jgi:hypothetical protein
MTRYLSEGLGAVEPRFSQDIATLERAGGMPSEDIRLTSEIMQKVRVKIAELGLDPKDTTGPELYEALRERLGADELRVRTALNIAEDASANDILARVHAFAEKLEVPKECFALKNAVAKKLLKKKPPKVAMKRLGYRSLESMLKHEHPASVYAAAVLFEAPSWHQHFRAQYANLQPSDFEQRTMAIIQPESKRWLEASAAFVENSKQNVLCFKELGTIVLLPIEAQVDGLAIISLLLTLSAMNDVRAHSSFAKLQQVKPTFGQSMLQASVTEPTTNAELAGQPVSWRLIHKFFARKGGDQPSVFEPHVQREDLQWREAEDVLAELEPSLMFWQDTQHLYLLHDGQPVSCNMFDVALNYCNHLPFEERAVHFLRDHLWHELMLRYLHQDNLESAVLGQLNQELEPELLDA